MSKKRHSGTGGLKLMLELGNIAHSIVTINFIFEKWMRVKIFFIRNFKRDLRMIIVNQKLKSRNHRTIK